MANENKFFRAGKKDSEKGIPAVYYLDRDGKYYQVTETGMVLAVNQNDAMQYCWGYWHMPLKI